MERQIRVLAVEDDPAARALLEGLIPKLRGLTLCGVAGDGYEGLELLRLQQPDLMLLDLVMPGLDGFGVLRALRQEPVRPVVVVASQVSDQNVVRHALALGASYYLVKPLHFEILPDLFRSLCLRPQVRAAEAYLTEVGASGLGVEAAAYAAAVLAQGPAGAIPLKEGYVAAMTAQNTSYACVEKNIRAMVGKLYAAGHPGYRDLMGERAEEKPSNETFLRRLAQRLREEE